MAHQQRDKDKLIAHLQQMPIVQIACKRTGVSRATYYRWRKDDPEFKAQSDDALVMGVDVINDLAESKVITGINNGLESYVKYWLNNRHESYYRLRAPSPPSGLQILEEEKRREIIKYRNAIRDFLDNKNDGGYPDKIN